MLERRDVRALLLILVGGSVVGIMTMGFFSGSATPSPAIAAAATPPPEAKPAPPAAIPEVKPPAPAAPPVVAPAPAPVPAPKPVVAAAPAPAPKAAAHAKPKHPARRVVKAHRAVKHARATAADRFAAD
jgi:outer membrane biosynthesis protein TonB